MTEPQPQSGGFAKPEFTERFQRVMAFASDEAEGMGHGYVTCQHVLYALSRENRGVAGAVLNELGLSPELLHSFLTESAAYHDRIEHSQLDLAEETREMISRAVQVALEWGHQFLDTEHLLFAIISQNCSALEILTAYNITVQTILKYLNSAREKAPELAIREEATHAYRFALESAWVLSMAGDIAQRKGSGVIASPHLLLALLSIPGVVQAGFQDVLHITAEKVEAVLPENASRSALKKRLPLSEDVQYILGKAIGEAWNRGHLSVSPIHLAMGLASAGRHAALDILADLGVSQSKLQMSLETIMPPRVL